jgi:hypothetical protein
LRRFAAAVTVATAGMAVAAASAQAAPTLGIAPVKPCYVSGESVNFLGGGYTVGAYVDIAIDGTSLGQLQANMSGAIGGTITLGTFKGAKSHTVKATDTSNTALTASLSFNGTTPQVTVKPRKGPAGRKRKMRGYGFMSGKKAYMHVRGHGISADTLVGRPKGPCGTWGPSKRRIVPAGAPSGTYKVRFDHKKKYSKNTKPQTGGTLTITRTFHAVGARATAFGWSAD